MDEKEILAIIDKGMESLGSKLDTQLAALNETAQTLLEPKPEDITPGAEVKAKGKAQMEEAGAVAGITNLQVWDIPVGQALVGGFVAVFASELIDGFLMQQGDMLKGAIKLAGAGAAVKWGKGLLGSTGAKAVALLLAYDGIRSLIPIDTWARKGSTMVTGMLPGGGLGGFRGGVTGSAVDQANQVADDYYARATGG